MLQIVHILFRIITVIQLLLPIKMFPVEDAVSIKTKIGVFLDEMDGRAMSLTNNVDI
jgi:hypothetical protein